MTAPAFRSPMHASSPTPLADLWQRSRTGVHVVRHAARIAPLDWQQWLREIFPSYVRYGFAPRHEELWEWAWAIDYPDAPRPFVGIWSRGGAKSTSAELVSTAVGVRGARQYGVYLRANQDRADDSVGNIARMLEKPEIEVYYPSHARPLLGKHGNSKGWRRNRVRTAGGFSMDAMGLDSAARGAKLDEQRPDFIILDDIDGKHDDAAATAKKIETITTSILPAGSENVAILAIQNLIIPDGFFSRMFDGRAMYLSRRIVSGPHPAVRGLKTELRLEPNEDGGPPTKRAMIVKGEATWEGQSLETCQKQIDEWGLDAFEKEAQHDVFGRVEGLVLNFDRNEHYVDMTVEQIRELVKLGQAFGGIDFGSWRFMFTAWAADTVGRAIRIEEVFSQREEMKVRARRIHEACVRVGIVRGEQLAIARFPIWGDSANPTDMTELNAAWRDGWRDETTGKPVTSPLRVMGVGKGKGILRTSIERINDKLGANAVLFVRSVGSGHRWLLGYNAGQDGIEQTGSRLMWEITHWSYPVPDDGEAQDQDPNDHTADGADGIASARYALMSWWKAAKEPEGEDLDAFSPEVMRDEADRSRTLRHRLKKSKRGRRSDRPIDDHFGEG